MENVKKIGHIKDAGRIKMRFGRSLSCCVEEIRSFNAHIHKAVHFKETKTSGGGAPPLRQRQHFSNFKRPSEAKPWYRNTPKQLRIKKKKKKKDYNVISPLICQNIKIRLRSHATGTSGELSFTFNMVREELLCHQNTLGILSLSLWV